MNEKLKRCEACNDPFYEDDVVVIVDDELYHRDCVTLYPIGYFAMLGGDPLGETENDEGSSVWDVLDEGEFSEEPK